MKRLTRTNWMMGTLGITLSVLAAARPLQAACPDGVWEEETEECDDGNALPGDGCSADCQVECTEVGAPATSHTCGHGAFGPFVTTSAQKYPGFIYSDVSSPHTYFTVALTGVAGVDHSGVLFNPGVSGAFAIYMKTNFPLAVRDSNGAEVPVYLEHAVSSCSVADSITWVKTYKVLSTEMSYTLDVGPSNETSVSLAIESLPGFAQQWYHDLDQDGWGGTLVGQSWCTLPAGYIPFGEDCDDNDPAVNPDATEVCDGVDANCDFRPDLETMALCDSASTGSVCRETAAGVGCGCDDDSSCTADATCNGVTHQCEVPALGEGGGGGRAGGEGGNAAEIDPTPDADAGTAGIDAGPSSEAGAPTGGKSSGEPRGGQTNTGGTEAETSGPRSTGGSGGSSHQSLEHDDEGDSSCQMGAARGSGLSCWAIVAIGFGVGLRRRRSRQSVAGRFVS